MSMLGFGAWMPVRVHEGMVDLHLDARYSGVVEYGAPDAKLSAILEDGDIPMDRLQTMVEVAVMEKAAPIIAEGVSLEELAGLGERLTPQVREVLAGQLQERFGSKLEDFALYEFALRDEDRKKVESLLEQARLALDPAARAAMLQRRMQEALAAAQAAQGGAGAQ